MAQQAPGYQPVYVLTPARPPVSGFAVAGFVLSLMWGVGILAIIGFALSIAGIAATSNGKRRGLGLGIAGMLIGFGGAVIGIGLLISLITNA